jgi:CRP-like cAMP-binding protein
MSVSETAHERRIPTARVAESPLARMPLWSALGPLEFEYLERRKLLRNHPAGDTLHEEGSAATGLICVTTGTVLVERASLDRQARRVRLVEPGGVVGWADFFGVGVHRTRAQCLTDVTVAVVPSVVLQELLRRQPRLGVNLLHYAAQEVEDVERGMLDQTHQSARRRLAGVLIMLKEHHGVGTNTGEIEILLPVSRRDLADLIAVRPETLSRLIRELEGDGIARFGFRNVRIPDLDLLLDEIEPDEDWSEAAELPPVLRIEGSRRQALRHRVN